MPHAIGGLALVLLVLAGLRWWRRGSDRLRAEAFAAMPKGTLYLEADTHRTLARPAVRHRTVR